MMNYADSTHRTFLRVLVATTAFEGLRAGAGLFRALLDLPARSAIGPVAFAAFSRARALGVEPQPGEALLRCEIGDGDTAWTELRVALAGEDRLGRMRLLRGAVEVALARNSLDEAERHCSELESGAEAFGTPGFRAWAAHARVALLVQQGRYREALDAMEQSELIAEALGEHVFEWFLRNKRAEWQAYKTQVTQFELDRYLRTL